MKRVITIVSLATALLAGSALAQSPSTPPAGQNDQRDAPIPQRSIKLTAEQGYVIKENVIPGGAENANKGGGTTGSANGKFEIGGKAPSGSDLKDFPDVVKQKVSAVKTYKYLVADGQVVIVDPKDNTIADILK
jgi:hypothetical protein